MQNTSPKPSTAESIVLFKQYFRLTDFCLPRVYCIWKLVCWQCSVPKLFSMLMHFCTFCARLVAGVTVHPHVIGICWPRAIIKSSIKWSRTHCYKRLAKITFFLQCSRLQLYNFCLVWSSAWFAFVVKLLCRQHALKIHIYSAPLQPYSSSWKFVLLGVYYC